MADDPHAPLRDDVRLLGSLLGETLKAQAGEALYQTVERVRALSKSARAGNDADFATLETLLSSLPVEHALLLTRAFSQFLTLANIAEQHHRIRRHRHYTQAERYSAQRASCEDAFARLVKEGVSTENLYKAVCSQ